MSTQVKAAVALVVVSGIAWVVWSSAFPGGPDAAAEAPSEIQVVRPAPEPKPERVQLVTPEPVPDPPAPTPRVRKRDTAATTAQETSRPAPERVVAPPPQPAAPGTISGIVVDVNGQPADASVAAVRASGSLRMTTERSDEQKGKFEFTNLGDGEFTITASTKAGQVAIQGGVRIDSTQGVAGLRLTLEQGAPLKITFDGSHDTARCAVTSNSVLIHDFTLRKGQTAEITVPPGMVFLQVYGGAGADRTVYEERSLSVFSGEENETTFVIR
ncbi:MAG: carboxypeptidase regulatory-like domain-containing protein [Planctomycetota bacterium]|nr:MAG: carboxypeptidase regulatory-like domain-containing protein [Planctomycetota bacterium]